MSHQATPSTRHGKVLATIVAVAFLLVPAMAQPAAAHPAPPALFDPDETSWLSIRGMSSSDFGDYFDDKVDEGYMVTDLEVDVIDGDYQVGAVFTDNPDDRGWVSKRNLTSTQFSDLWNEMRDRGYRIHDQETYISNGRRLWAGVWIENREDLGWASQRGLTSDQFSAEFQRRKDGMMPVDFERYETRAGPRYAIVWVENRDNIAWRLWRDATSQSFSDKFDEYKRDYRVIDVESSGGLYTGIWHANTNDRAWLLRRDMNANQYANYWNRYRDLGFRVVDFEVYDTAGGVRYAAAWRQNDDRHDWVHRQEVTDLVQTHVDDNEVPGMAVAVIQDGEVLFQRGFGHADIDADVWMDSNHVNRLASVSKPIGSTIAMQMVDEGLIDLDDEVQDYIDLPDGHDYTIGELISLRGCIGHYVDDDDGSRGQNWTTAAAVVPHIVDEPLVSGCEFGDYNYSTDAWAVAAMLFEEIDGLAIEQVVENRITALGLPTLQPEELAETNHRRAAIYSWSDGANVEVNRDDLSWKVLGGGMQSSVRDLAQFGWNLLDGQILDPDTFEEQTTPPNGSSNYAHGWSTGGSGSTFRVAHSGAQRGARTYIRLMPEDDLVIVVLSNRRNGGHSPSGLAVDIGQIVAGY